MKLRHRAYCTTTGPAKPRLPQMSTTALISLKRQSNWDSILKTTLTRDLDQNILPEYPRHDQGQSPHPKTGSSFNSDGMLRHAQQTLHPIVLLEGKWRRFTRRKGHTPFQLRCCRRKLDSFGEMSSRWDIDLSTGI